MRGFWKQNKIDEGQHGKTNVRECNRVDDKLWGQCEIKWKYKRQKEKCHSLTNSVLSKVGK